MNVDGKHLERDAAVKDGDCGQREKDVGHVTRTNGSGLDVAEMNGGCGERKNVRHGTVMMHDVGRVTRKKDVRRGVTNIVDFGLLKVPYPVHWLLKQSHTDDYYHYLWQAFLLAAVLLVFGDTRLVLACSYSEAYFHVVSPSVAKLCMCMMYENIGKVAIFIIDNDLPSEEAEKQQNASTEEVEEEKDEESPSPMQRIPKQRTRRGAVSAEVYTEEDAASYVKKKHPFSSACDDSGRCGTILRYGDEIVELAYVTVLLARVVVVAL
ncbi:hypothetical protein LSH36_523g01007 [Paralvinella palmiformis]|uniref:Uncharacterized protein n=1 Tax=Paralvinella palmiformis TaxID=53620 RepID=A0AAD9J7M5_9ANNE|nr:hypothetical protein LSH36_523g01007 [Paralvinella palmiformis]